MNAPSGVRSRDDVRQGWPGPSQSVRDLPEEGVGLCPFGQIARRNSDARTEEQELAQQLEAGDTATAGAVAVPASM
jgi:hypothetical protein